MVKTVCSEFYDWNNRKDIYVRFSIIKIALAVSFFSKSTPIILPYK